MNCNETFSATGGLLENGGANDNCLFRGCTNELIRIVFHFEIDKAEKGEFVALLRKVDKNLSLDVAGYIRALALGVDFSETAIEDYSYGAPSALIPAAFNALCAAAHRYGCATEMGYFLNSASKSFLNESLVATLKEMDTALASKP
ncbi:hypothetical protein WDW86_05655 [Bdellovibrionota bacterium FG-2]